MTERKQTTSWWAGIRFWAFLLGIALPLLLIVGGLILFTLPKDEAQIRSLRDIFVILLAVEFMFVGVALSILTIQLSRLSLLLELEIRPMLESAGETLRTLQGTSLFLSENLVEPIVRLNSSLAGIQRILEVFGLFRKPPK